MNRADWRRLANIRLVEAEALLRCKRPDGAYYLAGYAVECGLKACIARLTRRHDWPDKATVLSCHTHNLRDLLRLAGPDEALKADQAADPVLREHWTVAQKWTEQSRYARTAVPDARLMVTAVGDPTHGVLAWIRRHW